jgi:hypothetical protein
MDKRNSKIEDLKASINAKRGTLEDSDIRIDEADAVIHDMLEWYTRLTDDLLERNKQMRRLLDQHVPDWRARVNFPKTPPPPGVIVDRGRK